MMPRIISYILGCRLENVIALGFSAILLVLFFTTRLFHTFQINGHDIIFILVPAGILGVKTLMHLLFASEDEALEKGDAGAYLAAFFRPLLQLAHDWFPFFLLSACYYALYSNLMLRVNPHTADGVLSRIDAALLGNQASFYLQSIINPWLTDVCNLIYFSYVLSLPAVALYLYLKQRDTVFRRVMMGYLILMLMGVSSYLLVPAIGPGSYFATQYTHDLQGHLISREVDYIIWAGRVAYDCFPSLHVGIPLLLCLYIRDYRRSLFYPGMVYVGCMCFSTLYLRYHYLSDVIASFAYAPAAYFLNDFLLAKWPGERIVRRPAAEPGEPATVKSCLTD